MQRIKSSQERNKENSSLFLSNKNISYNKNSYKTIITLKCQEFNHLKEEIKIIPQFICRIKLVEIIQEVKL